jgi:hypothetical protein
MSKDLTQLHEAVKWGDASCRRRVRPCGGSAAAARAQCRRLSSGFREPRDRAELAAFFGRPEVTKLLLEAGSDPAQHNKHGLTPLACALGGAEGQWKRFSNASLEDWRRCVQLLSDSSSP